MLVWSHPDEINEWVSSQNGGRAHPGLCAALGWVEDGVITAGVVFHDSNGSHCLTNIAITGKRFPVLLLKASLRYAFGQLQLRRLTFIIREGNMPSINLVTRLGAVQEATLLEADINGGNMLIYALFPQNCNIWSRINGKVERRGASHS